MNQLYKNNLNLLKHFNKILYNKVIKLATTKEKSIINNNQNDLSNNIQIIKNYNAIDNTNIIISNQRTFSEGGEFYFSNFKIIQDIYQFQQIIDFSILQKEHNLKEIPNFIFFGIPSQSNFSQILTTIDAKRYLIIEPDIKKFVSSLFFIDYSYMFKNNLITICVETDQLLVITQMEDFIKRDYLNNYIYYCYISTYISDKFLTLFKVALENCRYDSYDHYRQLDYIKRASKTISKYKLLQYNIDNLNISNKPIFILSPGPSLRKNLLWIKENKDNIIVVSYGATLHVLEEFDIIPDIITITDASQVIKKQFPKNKKYLKKLKSSIAILTCNIYKDIFTFFKKKNTFLFESIFTFSNNPIPPSSAFTVGDITLHILLSLGFKNIYLVGTDLCLDDKTKSGYDKMHRDANIQITNNNIKQITPKYNTEEMIKVKSNFTNKQKYTTQFFFKILKSYTYIISYHQDKYNFNIYNLSDGAYIKGTIALPLNEVYFNKNIKNKSKQLKKLIKNKSIKNISSDKKKSISAEIITLELYKKDLNNFKNFSINDFNIFYDFIQQFMLKCSKNNDISDRIYIILVTYLNITIRYIIFYFNNKNITDNKKILNNIKQIFCIQFENILNQYITSVNHLK